MELFKSKYSQMPDNAYFDSRMAAGDSLSDIFDDTDYYSKVYTIDEERPICVRVGKLYNYVANNYLLFDNWFVVAQEFREFDKVTFAYRRFNSKGIREGGVLIRRNGSYVTREEFDDIVFGNHNGDGKYAIVKQKNSLYNIVYVETGTKVDANGISCSCLAYGDWNFIDFNIFVVANGNINGLYDTDWIRTYLSPEEKKALNLKCNFYSVNRGILYPTQWFDYVEPFLIIHRNGIVYYSKYAIVHLNNKVNFLSQEGKILSDTWFDVASVYGDMSGIAGILRSPAVKCLNDYCNDNYDYNPEKYILFRIDKYGKIRQI